MSYVDSLKDNAQMYQYQNGIKIRYTQAVTGVHLTQ